MSRHGPKNYIRRPDIVKRIGSYLGTSFPLFHDLTTVCRQCVDKAYLHAIYTQWWWEWAGVGAMLPPQRRRSSHSV